MEEINWLDIFENINIEKEEKIESYITTTLEQKKNYFSKASFSLTIQYLRNFKKETHLLSDNRKIEYISSLNIPPPKVGNSKSELFNQTVFEAQQNYYEFINTYKEELINRIQLNDNLSVYNLTPEEFYNHSKNEFIKHKMFYSEAQFKTDQLERLELLAEKYRNGIKNNIPVKISQNQFIKIKQYIQYFETLKSKKKRIKLEKIGPMIGLISLFVAVMVWLGGNNIIGRWIERDKDEIKADSSKITDIPKTTDTSVIIIEDKNPVPKDKYRQLTNEDISNIISKIPKSYLVSVMYSSIDKECMAFGSSLADKLTELGYNPKRSIYGYLLGGAPQYPFQIIVDKQKKEVEILVYNLPRQ